LYKATKKNKIVLGEESERFCIAVAFCMVELISISLWGAMSVIH
jgi:hypothetical protein